MSPFFSGSIWRELPVNFPRFPVEGRIAPAFPTFPGVVTAWVDDRCYSTGHVLVYRTRCWHRRQLDLPAPPQRH